jgi:hypothetical protein
VIFRQITTARATAEHSLQKRMEQRMITRSRAKRCDKPDTLNLKKGAIKLRPFSKRRQPDERTDQISSTGKSMSRMKINFYQSLFFTAALVFTLDLLQKSL